MQSNVLKNAPALPVGNLKFLVSNCRESGNVEFKLYLESGCGTVRNYLSDGTLYNFEDNLYELTSLCARSGFGGLVLNLLAQYCTTQDIYVTTVRDGDSRGALLSRFEEMTKSVGIQSVDVSEDYCEEVMECTYDGDPIDDYFECKAYRLPVTDMLTDALVTDAKDIPADWNDYFTICYESDTSKVLNEIEPLTLCFRYKQGA